MRSDRSSSICSCSKGRSSHDRATPDRTPPCSARSLFDREIILRACADSLVKLDPRRQARNPVMFTVEVGALVVLVFWLRDLVFAGGHNAGFVFAISAWLWFTVLFANFAEAVSRRGVARRRPTFFGAPRQMPRRVASSTVARRWSPRVRSVRAMSCASRRAS